MTYITERCTACGNDITVGSSHNRNFDSLYLTMLEIGQSKVETGITYHELIFELQKRGYNIQSGCIELAIKHWFFNAFFHKADKDCPLTTLEDLDTHLGCDFILKGETSLLLLEHQNTKRTLNLARNAIYVGVIAAIITFFGVLFTYDTLPKKDNASDIQIGTVPQPVQQTMFRQKF